MKDKNKLPKSMSNLLKEDREAKMLEPIRTNKITEMLGNFFSKKLEDAEKDKDTYPNRFTTEPKSDEEIEEIISNPDSPYHKLVKGYVYHIDVAVWLTTGCGGAQFMYKSLLREGMEENMIEQVIYASLDDSEECYPLAALKLKDEE